MKMPAILRKIIFTFLLLGLTSCQQDKNRDHHSVLDFKSKDETILENSFDYIVEGYDEDGRKVHGSINIEGNNGLGILTQNDGKLTEIVIESMHSKKRILATNDEGFKYHLTIISKAK